MHEFLSIVIGFEKGTVAGVATAELPLDTLVLTGSRGFALDPNEGWIPQMPALKDGGVWAESSTSTGRTLIAGNDGNVTESMRFVVGTGDPSLLAKYIVKMNRFIEMARQHWTTFFQTLPVYLDWKAIHGAGHQYALIYNIDMTVDYPGTNNSGVADVTLSIEREPYWRAIAPGANPKLWYFRNNNTPLNAATESLAPGNPFQWKLATISNKLEWSPTALGLQTTLLSQNYVQINAAEVPGDAPALVEFGVSADTKSLRHLYVAKSTKPTSGLSVANNTTRYNAYILAAGDAGLNLGSKVDVSAILTGDNGLISNGSSTVFYNYQYTIPLATTSFTDLLCWGAAYTGNLLNLDRTLMSGKFALLIRGIAETGNTGDVVLQLVIQEMEDNANQVVAEYIAADDIQVQVPGGGGFINYLKLHYAGVLTIPFESKRNTSPFGFGRQIRSTLGDWRIILRAKNTSGANRAIQISDLIMIPIDDEAIRISAPITGGSKSSIVVIYDNTGYLDLGTPNGAAKGYITNINNAVGLEINGGIITLEPGRDQRLYFLGDSLIANDGRTEAPTGQVFTVAVNIVPRWRGVRDQ